MGIPWHRAQPSEQLIQVDGDHTEYISSKVRRLDPTWNGNKQLDVHRLPRHALKATPAPGTCGQIITLVDTSVTVSYPNMGIELLGTGGRFAS